MWYYALTIYILPESIPPDIGISNLPERTNPVEQPTEALQPTPLPQPVAEAPLRSTRVLRPRKRPKDMRNYNVLKRVHDEIVREQAGRQPLVNEKEVGAALVADVNKMLEGSTSEDPTSFYKAINGEDASSWIDAMNSEINSLLENGTWTGVSLVDLKTANSSAIGSKWVFRTKLNPDNSIRYKARLVIKGYEQRQGIDYDITYAPVSRLPTLRILLAIASLRRLNIDHVDIITAFLNPEIDRQNVFMSLPDGFKELRPELEYSVVNLKKALYCLKQAPCLWYKAIDSLLVSMGFRRSTAEPNLYLKTDFYILLYVDDMLMVYTDAKTANEIKSCLNKAYKMSDLGPVRRFLGLEVERYNDGSYAISQTRYIETVLRRFRMDQANGVSTPLFKDVRLSEFSTDKAIEQHPYLQRVGALLYISLGTRPDITFAVSTLSGYCSNPHTVHQTAINRVLRYLKQTAHFKIHFPTSVPHPQLEGYTDADWANNKANRRSVGAYIFKLGGPISWQSKKQSIIATSTLESEYSAFLEAVKEALWLRQLLADLNWESSRIPTRSFSNSADVNTPSKELAGYSTTLALPTTIYTDSERAIQTVKSEGVTARNKHFDICLFKSREVQQEGIVNFTYIPSQDNAADGLTKALPESAHCRFLNMVGIQVQP